MPKTERSGPGSLKGMEFYDVDGVNVFSFCPDSDDASTPATQVHMELRIKGARAPLVARFHGPNTLDGVIEALIEHRTYVFGRRDWKNDFEEQARDEGGD